jgi:hypothetical protein
MSKIKQVVNALLSGHRPNKRYHWYPSVDGQTYSSSDGKYKIPAKEFHRVQQLLKGEHIIAMPSEKNTTKEKVNKERKKNIELLLEKNNPISPIPLPYIFDSGYTPNRSTEYQNAVRRGIGGQIQSNDRWKSVLRSEVTRRLG